MQLTPAYSTFGFILPSSPGIRTGGEYAQSSEVDLKTLNWPDKRRHIVVSVITNYQRFWLDVAAFGEVHSPAISKSIQYNDFPLKCIVNIGEFQQLYISGARLCFCLFNRRFLSFRVRAVIRPATGPLPPPSGSQAIIRSAGLLTGAASGSKWMTIAQDRFDTAATRVFVSDVRRGHRHGG